MSITQPIFPGLAPPQNYTLPNLPVRSPKWNFKEVAQWMNYRQQAVNGRVLVTKYWQNPLWSWDWVYGYIKDNPFDSNPFYTIPIPATDFEILKSFFNGMQGSGNEFAYQPPDSARGYALGINLVTVLTNGVALLQSSSTAANIAKVRLGDNAVLFGFSTATYLNGKVGTVIARNTISQVVTVLVSTSGTHSATPDSGTALCGQPLLAPDSNGNVEIVNTIGSYPTTISPTPATTLVTESVQLMDTSTLDIYDSTGANINGHFTLASPETVSPYEGYVAEFSSYTTNQPWTAIFNYYYLCRFAEDAQEWDNFISQLWLASSVKFGQIRI